MFEIIHRLKKISQFEIHSSQVSKRVLKRRLWGGVVVRSNERLVR
jgi:hypothetical protein